MKTYKRNIFVFR